MKDKSKKKEETKELRFKGGGFRLGSDDDHSLASLVRSLQGDNLLIAEIGSWMGSSTFILANEVIRRNGKVFAIDHWEGSEGTLTYKTAQTQDVYSIFKDNMVTCGFWNTVVYPMVMDSQTASQIFADGILDLVFIDADHHYEHVKQDILSWLPKLKVGGILCGHDCELYYSQSGKDWKEIIDKNLDIDYKIAVHPGVIKALHDCFADNHSLMPATIWYYKKGMC